MRPSSGDRVVKVRHRQNPDLPLALHPPSAGESFRERERPVARAILREPGGAHCLQRRCPAWCVPAWSARSFRQRLQLALAQARRASSAGPRNVSAQWWLASSAPRAQQAAATAPEAASRRSRARQDQLAPGSADTAPAVAASRRQVAAARASRGALSTASCTAQRAAACACRGAVESLSPTPRCVFGKRRRREIIRLFPESCRAGSNGTSP